MLSLGLSYIPDFSLVFVLLTELCYLLTELCYELQAVEVLPELNALDKMDDLSDNLMDSGSSESMLMKDDELELELPCALDDTSPVCLNLLDLDDRSSLPPLLELHLELPGIATPVFSHKCKS